MEKNFNELIEKTNNQNFNLNKNNQSRYKSISFNEMINDSNLCNKNNKRTRFYSENIPLNFVPRLKPINPKIKPTPMKLNCTTSKKKINNIISEEIENKLSLSFENYSSNENYSNLNIDSDSDSDSNSYLDSIDDEYKGLNYKLNFNNTQDKKKERKLSHIKNLKNEMNQIKKEVNKQKNSHDDLDSETPNKTISQILNKDINNQNNYQNGKKGVSIIQFLEENSPNFDKENFFESNLLYEIKI